MSWRRSGSASACGPLVSARAGAGASGWVQEAGLSIPSQSRQRICRAGHQPGAKLRFHCAGARFRSARQNGLGADGPLVSAERFTASATCPRASAQEIPMAKNPQFTKKPQFTKNTQFNTWYWLAAIFGILVIQYLFGTAGQIATIPYSEFQQLLQGGKVAEIGISDNFIQGRLKEPLPSGQTLFSTTRVDPAFAQELQPYGVKYTGRIESTFLRDILSWVLPVLVFFVV